MAEAVGWSVPAVVSVRPPASAGAQRGSPFCLGGTSLIDPTHQRITLTGVVPRVHSSSEVLVASEPPRMIIITASAMAKWLRPTRRPSIWIVDCVTSFDV